MSKSTQSSKPSPPDKGKMVSPSVKPTPATESKKPAPAQQESQPDSVPAASASSEPQATVKTDSQAKAQPPKGSPEAPASDVSSSPTPRYYVRYRKPNYIKYDRNKQVLVDLLRTGTHSTEFIAHKAGIASNSTLFKYQSLASNESGLLLMTKEERDYMRDKIPADTMVKIDDKFRDQNQGWKDRYQEAEARFVIQQKETPIQHKPRDTSSPRKTKAPKVQA